MVTGIIGRKVGMTQVFLPDGTVVPATVIKAGPCVVVQAKGHADRRLPGRAARSGRRQAVEGKPRDDGHYKKAGVPATRVRREVKLAKGAEAPKAGDQVLVDIFKAGEQVDVIGTGPRQGFPGRHEAPRIRGRRGDARLDVPSRAGVHRRFVFPSRVVKGMRAAGRMGGGRVTTHNLKVVSVDAGNHLLVLRGAVPGAPDGIVVIRRALKAKPEPQPQAEKKSKSKK
jgi:large subunit ribosomal protein L3